MKIYCSNRYHVARSLVLACGLLCLECRLTAQDTNSNRSEKGTVESLNKPNTSISQDETQAKGSHVKMPIKVEGAILKTIDSTAVSAQVSGILNDATLREGALVKKGQCLAKIHDSAVRIKLDQIKLQISIAMRKRDNSIDKQVASKNREVAETEYQRALSANEKVPNTYPLNEVDRLKLVAERSRLEEERAVYNMQMAALEAEVANSDYVQTEDLLARHSITSPVDGMIVAVEKKLGEWVEPGTEVYRIVRTDTLRIEGLIPVNTDDGNLIGRSVSVELLRGDRSQMFVGKVVFVSPDANPVNSLVRVYIEVENPERKLRPGLQVRAEISAEEPNQEASQQ